MAQKNERRLRAVVVELSDKARQHLLDRKLAVVARKIGAVPPVLPAAKEEHFDAGLTALLVGGDDVGVDDRGNVDILMALHQGQGANPVADQTRGLEVEAVGGLLHLAGKTVQDPAALAGE